MKARRTTPLKLLKHQHEFVKDTSNFVGIVCGFAAGKSDADVFRAAELLKMRHRLGQKGVVVFVVPSYRIIKDTNLEDIMRILRLIGIRYKWNGSDMKFICPDFNGEIWLRSCDRPEKIVGFDATDAILDEFDVPKPNYQRQTWININARLRGAKNATLAVSTTPEGFKYTYELFITRNIGRIINAATWDNIELPPSYVWNNIIRQYGQNVPEEMPEFKYKFEYRQFFEEAYNKYRTPLLDQYGKGLFVNTNGLLAYYGFNRDKHMLKQDHRLIKQAEKSPILYVGMDFNVGLMCSTISAMVSEKNGDPKLITFDEIRLPNSNTHDMCRTIKELYPDKYINVCPDSTGVAKDSTSAGLNDFDIIRKYGFEIDGSYNGFVRDSLICCNTAFNQGNVLISEKCTYLIGDLEKVVTNEYGQIDKAQEKLGLTHISDAQRYKVNKLFPIVKNFGWKQ